jgi:hypothetical protein
MLRKDYINRAAIGFIAALVFYFIWYYFDHSGVSLIIAVAILAASIYFFVKGIIRPKSTPLLSQPVPQPTPAPSTVPIDNLSKPDQSMTQSSPQVLTPLCPTCGQPLIFLEDTKKWYCQNEKKIVTTESQTIEKELEVERQKIRKELEILDKHLKDGKVSKKVYKELKHKFQSRLEEIE